MIKEKRVKMEDVGVLVKDEVKKKNINMHSNNVSFPRRLSPWDHVNQVSLYSLGEAKEGCNCIKKWVGERNIIYEEW